MFAHAVVEVKMASPVQATVVNSNAVRSGAVGGGVGDSEGDAEGVGDVGGSDPAAEHAATENNKTDSANQPPLCEQVLLIMIRLTLAHKNCTCWVFMPNWIKTAPCSKRPEISLSKVTKATSFSNCSLVVFSTNYMVCMM
jgi:hypothetical protein